MKKLLLLFGIFCLVNFTGATAKDNNKSDEVQQKSQLVDQLSDPAGQTTYPTAFEANAANPRTAPAISTGYYYVDSRETGVPDFWRPSPDYLDREDDPNSWHRIMSGPRQVDSTYWRLNPDEGLAFFRNPAIPTDGSSYFQHGLTHATDSTNDAIAGPIPLGISGGFYFNGIRYDSFYVSTNGVIALTNRRYFYNTEGEVTIPPGSENAYDPMSMDWFANGRARTGTGLESTRLPDNFGYQYSVLGNAPMTATAGIRSNSPSLEGFDVANKAALIAPMWGPMQFMQYDDVTAQIVDWSRVYYRRSNAGDKIVISYERLQPQAGNRTFANFIQGSHYTAPEMGKSGEVANYVDADFQVVLDRNDSSITYQYGTFRGGASIIIPSGRTVPQDAWAVMQLLSVSGVRGFARHVNFDGENGTYPWAGEYEQATVFNNQADSRNITLYGRSIAVKFRQYKNALRIFGVKYMVRTQDADADNEFNVEVPSSKVDNYELLAGEEKIGAMQAVVTIQNLTNDIQGPTGVNYVPQDLNFQARMKITNQATDEIVYSSIVPVNDSTLSLQIPNATEKVRYFDPFANNGAGQELTYTNDMSGIPPYGFAQVTFRPFEPSEIENRYHGRLQVTIIADPTDPTTKEGFGDQWPFDDTTKVKLWVMTRLTSFKDDVTEFYDIEDQTTPSVLKWVNLGAETVSGDQYSLYPVAPRGAYQDQRKKNAWLNSPALLLDRVDENGSEWDVDQNPLTPEGDELRSFPVNLSGKLNPVLTMSVQRSIQNDQTNRDRGFCDVQLTGPEPRTVVLATGNVFTANFAASKFFDELNVEFAYPSPDGIKNICNMDSLNWRTHKRQSSTSTIAHVSAYTLYGAGGHCCGFFEGIKDSALTIAQGLRYDRYDDGYDWDYNKIFVPIPNYILNAANNGARNFRFRLHVVAYNHYNAATRSGAAAVISDDRDPFIVDNVAIIAQQEEADVEVSSVKVKWPYKAVPASQATNVPVSVLISNNSSLDSKTFVIRTFITKGADTVYCRYKTVTMLETGKTYTYDMPAWNARISGPGQYRLHAQLHYIGNTVDGVDVDTTNDYNYHDIVMTFSDVYSYEASLNSASQVADDAQVVGRGLNLSGYSYGATGNVNGLTNSYYNELLYGCGYPGGDGSGQIAVKFNVLTADTIKGFQAFFTTLSVDVDNIYLSVYSDQNGMPGTMLSGSRIERRRGEDDVTGQTTYGQYVTYLLGNPIALPTGTYWVAIAQRGAYGLELGGRKDRMGMRTTGLAIPEPVTQGGALGNGGYSLLVDKDLRNSDGTNNNLFAYENSYGSNAWNQFMSTSGNPGYAHMDHFGLSTNDYATYTETRGTWIPMLRPYFGNRDYGTSTTNVSCPPATLDTSAVPVELDYFNGQSRNKGIELFWATASEANNKGFYVEKAQMVDGIPVFDDIAFVQGAGNSQTENQYSYVDKNVENGQTYRYRLRQVDLDGSNCDVYSDDIEVAYNYNGEVVLEQNAPNPFASTTNITFTLTSKSNVKLDVIDIYGNVVKTLVNGEMSAQKHTVAWDGVNENGASVASGSYIYRLNVDGKILNGKMSIVR